MSVKCLTMLLCVDVGASAGGGAGGSRIESVPLTTARDGDIGENLVGAAGDIGAGEGHAASLAAATTWRRLDAVAVVMEESVAADSGSLDDGNGLAVAVLDAERLVDVDRKLEIFLGGTRGGGTIPSAHAAFGDDSGAVDVEVSASVGRSVDTHFSIGERND